MVRVFNIGNSHPIPLMASIEAVEAALGVKAEKRLLPVLEGLARFCLFSYTISATPPMVCEKPFSARVTAHSRTGCP